MLAIFFPRQECVVQSEARAFFFSMAQVDSMATMGIAVPQDASPHGNDSRIDRGPFRPSSEWLRPD